MPLNVEELDVHVWMHREQSTLPTEIAQAVCASTPMVGEYLRRARLAGITWTLSEGITEFALEAVLFPMRSTPRSNDPCQNGLPPIARWGAKVSRSICSSCRRPGAAAR